MILSVAHMKRTGWFSYSENRPDPFRRGRLCTPRRAPTRTAANRTGNHNTSHTTSSQTTGTSEPRLSEALYGGGASKRRLVLFQPCSATNEPVVTSQTQNRLVTHFFLCGFFLSQVFKMWRLGREVQTCSAHNISHATGAQSFCDS